MNMLKQGALLGGALLTLSGCITFPTDDSNQVKVLWDNPPALAQCRHLGTVIGSQGHFYDYWLHADRDMLWGTLNEMRIKTAAMGGDTLYLYQPLGFIGSVTLLGNAYQCGAADISDVSSR